MRSRKKEFKTYSISLIDVEAMAVRSAITLLAVLAGALCVSAQRQHTVQLTKSNWHLTKQGSWLICLDARHCTACKQVAPAVEQLAQTFNAATQKYGIIVGSVNIDTQPGARAPRAITAASSTRAPIAPAAHARAARPSRAAPPRGAAQDSSTCCAPAMTARSSSSITRGASYASS
jgi:thiol-disulfide isomerase/thioredoxin